MHRRDLRGLQAETEAMREQRRLEKQRRLDNGCEHDFESPVLGMPPGACSKCGIEKEKPAGQCDHLWKHEEGSISSSYCEKCGETYNAASERGSFV
jgi:hypothetical protein